LPLGREQVPSHRAHHPRRDRRLGVAQEIGEGVTHRDDPLSDLEIRAFAERSHGEAPPVDLEDRDVGQRVLTEDLCREVTPVARRHDDLLGALSHVLVGDHEAVR